MKEGVPTTAFAAEYKGSEKREREDLLRKARVHVVGKLQQRLASLDIHRVQFHFTPDTDVLYLATLYRGIIEAHKLPEELARTVVLRGERIVVGKRSPHRGDGWSRGGRGQGDLRTSPGHGGERTWVNWMLWRPSWWAFPVRCLLHVMRGRRVMEEIVRSSPSDHVIVFARHSERERVGPDITCLLMSKGHVAAHRFVKMLPPGGPSGSTTAPPRAVASPASTLLDHSASG